MLRPALGGGRGPRAVREPAPGAVPVVADGTGTDARAGADCSGAVARAGTDTSAVARGDADARGLAGAGTYPAAGAHAGPGADLDAPGATLAVAAAPMAAAALAVGRRRLVPPLNLVAGSGLAPATLVVMSGTPGHLQ